MKKFTFIILFWTVFLPLMAQNNWITIQGYVTDVANGSPVMNHAVTIQTDSSSGTFYYNVVYTWSSGLYLDTIFFPSGVPTSNLFVSTLDCNQNTQFVSLPFSPGNQSLTHDFQICTTPAPCNADFSYQSVGMLTVQFTDLSTGVNYTRQWQFGDGGTSNLANPMHSYLIPGYYTTVLTISNSAAGCWDSVSKTILVGDSTTSCTAMFYATPDSGNPMNVFFHDQSTGSNIASWFWHFGDGVYSTQQNPVHLYAQQGIYNVCLTIQSNDSSCYSVYCDTLVVGNSPGGCQAQFTWYADSMNTSQIFHFIDLSIGGGVSWFWDFGDPSSGSNNTSTQQNPVHIFTQNGTYYVCLTITGQNPACQSTWCANVTVGNNSGCASYFIFSQNSLTVSFEGHMVNSWPATYAWNFGDGNSGSGQNVTHTYASQGMYYVSLTTTADSTNCTFNSGQTIQVGDSGQFNQIYGQVLENNFPLSSGIAMIFSVDTTNTLPYFDISLIDTSGIYSFPYVPQGHFVVWVIPTDSSEYLPTYYGDVITWQQATVITLGTPVNPYNIHLVLATNASAGPGGINGHINTGGLKSSVSDKIRMILMNEQGNPIGFRNLNSSGDFDFYTLRYGIYFLRAELPGCPSDLVRVEITQEKPIVDVVMTYSGNRLLGINEPTNLIEGLTIYPNPVTDQLNLKIELIKDAPVIISLCDFSSRVVYTNPVKLLKGNNTLQINTANLQPGMFLLRITSENGTNIIQKVIK